VWQPLQPDDLAKQTQLAVIGFRELAQDHTCGAIEGSGRKEVVKRWRHHPEDIVRETRGAGEIYLQACVMEVLRPQEDQHALGGELVLAQLDTGVLDVFRQLGKEEVAMARCRRKGLDL